MSLFSENDSRNFIPVLAYSKEFQIFLLEDNSIGFAFECVPLPSPDERLLDQLHTLFNQEWPYGTSIQFSLYSSPDLDRQFSNILWQGDVYGEDTFTNNIRKNRVNFFKEHTSHYIDSLSKIKIRNNKLIVSIKVPYSGTIPTDKNIEILCKKKDIALQILSTTGLNPRCLDAAGYIRIMQTILNREESATWRGEEIEYDENNLIKNQIFDYDIFIEKGKNTIHVGENYQARTLSVKKLPESTHIGMAVWFLCDPFNGSRGITENVLISTTVIIEDPHAKRTKYERERTWVANQCLGPLRHFAPKLTKRLNDYDIVVDGLNGGDVIISMCLSVSVIARNDQIESTVADISTFWRGNGFFLMEDCHARIPIFLNNLPFCGEIDQPHMLKRYRSMPARTAICFLPIFACWKGTPSPIINVVGRDGQLMNYDLYDSSSNYNCVVAAESGSGKSFLTNEVISSYLSTGSRIWVIDVGRSYENLTNMIGGQFMVFGEKSNICLNPFDIVENYNEEVDVLVAIIASMAAPSESLSDYQIAGLRRILGECWQEHGKDLSIDILAERLKEDTDPKTRVKDIGEQLFPFTKHGEYGRYFAGKNNVNFENDFITIELEELKGKKGLQKVILLLFIFKIQQEMYLGIRDRRKILVIDESWDLLGGDKEVAKFITTAYRRFRKYNGSAIVITQALADLNRSEGGAAILENSAHKILLGQTSEAINYMKENGLLDLPDAGYELLKTVHTIAGKYSEAFFYSRAGCGIGRLYVEDYKKLLYSTKPDDINDINAVRKETGLSLDKAIMEVIKRRKMREAV